MSDALARDFAHRHHLTALFETTDGVKEKSPFSDVDPSNKEPYKPEWVDLANLFCLLRQRKVTQTLEFGCGFSTSIFAHALELNEQDFGINVRSQLRKIEPFHHVAVDDQPEFITITRNRLNPKFSERVSFHLSPVRMTTFSDRICTEYDTLPNICPDFIYLDGPGGGGFSAAGDINGISTRHAERPNMACDILKIEHFLLPGTLILVDGRTANARFLKANLQREWRYEHDVEGDVHYFEMIEEPLGKWNRRQIEFCLGSDWRAKPLRPDLRAL